MAGYIKLHRQITENKLWFSERFTKSQAWIDLLLLANHKPATFFIRGNEVKVERGQSGYAITTLAKRWKWNKRTVDKFLSMLLKDEMIHYRKSPVTTIITIKNYHLYQDDAQQNAQQNSNRMHNRVHTNNNDKNDKNILITIALTLINEVKSFKTVCSLVNKYKSALGEDKLLQILTGCYSRKVSFATENKLAAYLQTCTQGNGKITDNIPEIKEGIEKWMK